MKVRLVWDTQFCGRLEEIVDVKESATEEEIKKLFPIYLGMEYDENCYFEIINGVNNG